MALGLAVPACIPPVASRDGNESVKDQRREREQARL